MLKCSQYTTLPPVILVPSSADKLSLNSDHHTWDTKERKENKRVKLRHPLSIRAQIHLCVLFQSFFLPICFRTFAGAPYFAINVKLYESAARNLYRYSAQRNATSETCRVALPFGESRPSGLPRFWKSHERPAARKYGRFHLFFFSPGPPPSNPIQSTDRRREWRTLDPRPVWIAGERARARIWITEP